MVCNDNFSGKTLKFFFISSMNFQNPGDRHNPRKKTPRLSYNFRICFLLFCLLLCQTYKRENNKTYNSCSGSEKCETKNCKNGAQKSYHFSLLRVYTGDINSSLSFFKKLTNLPNSSSKQSFFSGISSISSAPSSGTFPVRQAAPLNSGKVSA